MAFRSSPRRGDFRRRGLFRIPDFHCPRTGRARGTQIGRQSAADAGHQPAGISSGGEIESEWEADRSARCADRLHPKISEWSARRRSRGSARRNQYGHSDFHLSIAGKRGIHRKKRRRPRSDRGKTKIDAGADYAHEQSQRNDATHRRQAACFAS